VDVKKWHKVINAASSSSSSNNNSTSGYGPNQISSVAWSHNSTEYNAKPLLLGTTKGGLYHATLPSVSNTNSATVNSNGGASSGSASDSADIVSVANLTGTTGGAVDSLYYTSTSTTATVLCTTTTNSTTAFHSFTYNTNLTGLPVSQDKIQSLVLPGVLPRTASSTPSSPSTCLRVHENSFCCLTSTGLFHGTLSLATSTDPSIITATNLIPYADMNLSPTAIPIDVAYTKYHIMLLKDDGSVTILSRIDYRTIQTLVVNAPAVNAVNIPAVNISAVNAPPLSMPSFIIDVRRPSAAWLRLETPSGSTLYHISSPHEDRDVWSLMLNKLLSNSNRTLTTDVKKTEREFDYILSITTGKARYVVMLLRSNYHISIGDYVNAAKWSSKLPRQIQSVSESVLNFVKPTIIDYKPTIHRNDNNDNNDNNNNNNNNDDKEASKAVHALIEFLNDALSRIDKNGVRAAMIGAWLTELMMSARNSATSSSSIIGTFLAQNARYFDAPTTLRILAAHDAAPHEICAAAAASGDVGPAAKAALEVKSRSVAGARKGGAIAALKILQNADLKKFEGVYIRNARQLFGRAGPEAAEAFLNRYSDGLDPQKVLPALVYVYRSICAKKLPKASKQVSANPLAETENNDEDESESDADSDADDDTSEQHAGILKYLEGVIKFGCQSIAIHNFLVTVYIGMEDDLPLFRYLSNITAKNCYIDRSFALRCILKSRRHHRSAVKLYMGMGMQKEAVSLALKVDPVLARELAKGAHGTEKKRLWLMIAKSAATGTGDAVARVIAELRESNNSLSIEDVLPFLPDFATIDEFKDEICSALQGYSDTVAKYKEELAEADLVCEGLEEEIGWLEKQEVKVGEEDRCAISGKSLEGDVYAFRSGFVVRVEEMRRVVWEVLDEKQRERVEWLEAELKSAEVDRWDGGNGGGDGEEGEAKRERVLELRKELDGLIAAECPCTGDLMIESVGVPLSGWDE
jgi:hypothetical protein